MGKRVDKLVKRLRVGADSTMEFLTGLSDAQWEVVLYKEPYPWTVRDLLAHLLWTEEGLMRIARDIAAGGPGAPEGLDYDDHNAQEHARTAGIPIEELLPALTDARAVTIAWVSELDEAILNQEGNHPALGQVTLETLINIFHGHQLMHMRDLKALLRS